jgi:hypothetical protein
MTVQKFRDRPNNFEWRDDKNARWDKETIAPKKIFIFDVAHGLGSVSKQIFKIKKVAISDFPKGRDILKPPRVSLKIKDHSGVS